MPDQCKKQGGRVREKLQDRVQDRRNQEKKKIQDKFPAQESSYSVITVDAKVKKLKHAVHIKCYLCFPSQMKEKYKRTERKCMLSNSTLPFAR